MTVPRLKWPAAYDLACSDDGRLLACLGRNVVVIDLAAGQRVSTNHPLPHPSGAAFAPDGDALAVKATNGRIVVINTRSGEVLHDHMNQQILPADLTRGVYRSGTRPEDLYRTIATGLEGAEPGNPDSTNPMPTYGLAVIVGREGLVDLGENAPKLDAKTRGQVTAFIANLPTQDRIDSLNDAQRAYIGERRIWLMVGYIRSLVRPRGPFDFLFDDVQSR